MFVFLKFLYFFRFFLFFRDLILGLRELREVDFLENISLDFKQWPKIVTGICAWDKKFSENTKELCIQFEELYRNDKGRFNQVIFLRKVKNKFKNRQKIQ